MKRALSIVLLSLSVSASAEICWVNAPQRLHRWSRPAAVLSPWGEYRDLPSDEFLARCSWLPYEVGCASVDAAVDYDAVPPVRCLTAQEIEDRAAAEAAAQAEAEAQATLPQMSATGYAAPNEAGHWVKFVPAGTNAVTEMLGIQISHSPPDPETAALLEAEGIAAHEAKKAAKKAKRDSARGKANKANSVPAMREAFAELLDSLED